MRFVWSFWVRIPVVVASVALFILMGLTFCDVLFRSLFNAPIEAATEITRLLMAVIVFSVLPLVSVQKKHIAVDLCDGLFQTLHLERLWSLDNLACLAGDGAGRAGARLRRCDRIPRHSDLLGWMVYRPHVGSHCTRLGCSWSADFDCALL